MALNVKYIIIFWKRFFPFFFFPRLTYLMVWVGVFICCLRFHNCQSNNSAFADKCDLMWVLLHAHCWVAERETTVYAVYGHFRAVMNKSLWLGLYKWFGQVYTHRYISNMSHKYEVRSLYQCIIPAIPNMSDTTMYMFLCHLYCKCSFKQTKSKPAQSTFLKLRYRK